MDIVKRLKDGSLACEVCRVTPIPSEVVSFCPVVAGYGMREQGCINCTYDSSSCGEEVNSIREFSKFCPVHGWHKPAENKPGAA